MSVLMFGLMLSALLTLAAVFLTANDGDGFSSA
jgi:hypothetical protein